MAEPKPSIPIMETYTRFVLTLSSTFIVRLFSFPLYTGTFRIQKFTQPISHKNILEAVFADDYSKGYRAWPGSLYSGFGAKLMESTIKKSIKIVAQPLIEQKLDQYVGSSISFIKKPYYDVILAGMSGAVVGNSFLITYPLEHIVYLKRSISHDNRFVWQIILNDNKYLLRGLSVAWPRNIISNAIPFAVIEATKSQEHSELKATLISSVLNVFFTGPFEAVLECMRDDKKLPPKTAFEAFNHLAKKGVTEFYRGTTVTLFAKSVKQVTTIVAANMLLEKHKEVESQNNSPQSPRRI